MQNIKRPARWRRRHLALVLILGWLLAACAPTGQLSPAVTRPSGTATPEPVTVVLVADGQTRQFITTAVTVAGALAEAGITLNPADEVDPPPSQTLAYGAAEPLVIAVVRVTESLEVIPESIPYGRQVVRSAELSPDDPPRLLQEGAPGRQEVSVRIVYRDGLEVERWPTSVTVVEPPLDEIVLVGVGSSRDAMPVAGQLAYVNDGRAIILAGDTESPRQLGVEGQLDGRVFQLSPDGNYLLYTTGEPTATAPAGFRNELWVIATVEAAVAVPLQIGNVLWAGWDPAAVGPYRIAYSTARSVSLPPGWEANNDLWLMELPFDGPQPAPVRLVETYPAAYAWWGGNYAWSPDGERLAYAFADEVGLLDIPAGVTDGATLDEPARAILHTFTAYDTGADWAWTPALGWSADGQTLAFTAHDGFGFDVWQANVTAGRAVAVVLDAGLWSQVAWSPESTDARLLTTRANDPAAGEDGRYALWLADGDGSNAARLFPPADETGTFTRTAQSLAWGADGNSVAFLFDDGLHILDLATGDVFVAGPDDTISNNLTWAPYGPAAR